MIFAKFQSRTHKIDTMIIHEIKREMPLKYFITQHADQEQLLLRSVSGSEADCMVNWKKEPKK